VPSLTDHALVTFHSLPLNSELPPPKIWRDDPSLYHLPEVRAAILNIIHVLSGPGYQPLEALALLKIGTKKILDLCKPPSLTDTIKALDELGPDPQGPLATVAASLNETIESLQAKKLMANAVRAGFWRDAADIPSHRVTAALKARSAAYTIGEIKHPVTGVIDSSPSHLTNSFLSFYSHLYSPVPTSSADHHSLLQHWNPQPIWTWAPTIGINELQPFLASLPTHKAPGPDGISYALYKIFAHEVTPILSRAFTAILQGSNLPLDMLHCHICTFYKGKGNTDDIGNRRPISLLNTDYKIFSAIITSRLYGILSPDLSFSQNGFVPGRLIYNNVAALYEVLEDINSTQSP